MLDKGRVGRGSLLCSLPVHGVRYTVVHGSYQHGVTEQEWKRGHSLVCEPSGLVQLPGVGCGEERAQEGSWRQERLPIHGDQ